jgi:hypothetical protein
MKKPYPIWIILLLCVFYSERVLAQELGNNSGFFSQVDAGAHIGFVWPHDPALDNLYQGVFPGFHIALTGQTLGNRPWHHAYNFPELGVSLLFSHLGYPEVLGHGFGLMPHITLPLTRGQGLQLQLRYGVGVGYVTNHYREPHNMDNQAVSAPLNIAMSTTLQASIPLSGAFTLRPGISITHFSNGKTRVPNKGLNLPSAKVELVHHFRPRPVMPARESEPEKYSAYSMAAYLSGGYSELYPPGGDKYAEFTLSTTLRRRISQKVALGLGGDIFWGLSDREMLYRRGETDVTLGRLIKPGLHLAYEQVFSNTSFIIQKGVYLHTTNPEDGKTYNRAGFRHRLDERWQLNLTIKTHLFRADYLEWGIGYTLF